MKAVLSSKVDSIASYLGKVGGQIPAATKEQLAKSLEMESEKLLAREGEKDLAKVITKRGGKAVAQILVKQMMKDIPVVTIAFFLADVRSHGGAYAIRNAVLPADLINEMGGMVVDNLQGWMEEQQQMLNDKQIRNAGGDPNATGGFRANSMTR